MRVPWLANVLMAGGLTVRELPGWKGRGGDLRGLRGVVCHHTATGPDAADEVVARILRDGHAKLRGPLSQLGLDRSGTFWVIADGRCAHNGYGLWGNESLGIEAFNNGRGEPWPDRQVDAWHKGCAAICKHLDFDVSQIKGHKETDPRRKVDPHGIDMGLFRTNVRRLLTIRTPEEIMATGDYIGYVLDPEGKPDKHGRRPIWALHKGGGVHSFNGAPYLGGPLDTPAGAGKTWAAFLPHPTARGYVAVPDGEVDLKAKPPSCSTFTYEKG